jgi:TetR/AcrR family transcriptional regulator, transcriptional repressor for nem operon
MAKPNLREQILTAGFETLYTKGFNATSVQDIAEAAHAPKGSFYNHFDSKEALGVAVVGEYVARVATLQAILEDAATPPLARLRKYFETLDDAPSVGNARGCLLGNFGAELSNQSGAIRECVSMAFANWIQALAKVINEAQRRGDMSREGAPETLAAFVVEAWEGAVMRRKVERNHAPMDVFFEIAFSKVLK